MDVTTQVKVALAGKTADAANKALRAELARLQQTAALIRAFAVPKVSLHHGGIYNLYLQTLHSIRDQTPWEGR
jgi:hypothetical protein